MFICSHCGELADKHYDPASGSSSCSRCGMVSEESAIVSELTFGETAGGAAIVTGSYVGVDQTGARTVGPGGRRNNNAESSAQSIANGKREISRLGNALGLSDKVIDIAGRWYQIAISTGFVKGRRIVYVAAACAYIACRTEKTTHMLIDFSDQLQVNVFVLGSTYLKLLKEADSTNAIPAIDPSLYITRFTQLLDFGDETQKVAQDAVRLVQRFNRDWMNTGRRPAGICGACCLLAARMNNFRRSVAEIVQVVKIADITIKKRLEEFKHTPTGQLTVQDFRSVWLEEGADPPAFIESEKRSRVEAERANKKKRKRAETEEMQLFDDAEDNEAIDSFAKDVEAGADGDMVGGLRMEELDGIDLQEEGVMNEDALIGGSGVEKQQRKKNKGKEMAPTPEAQDPEELRLEKEVVEPAIEADVQEHLDSNAGAAILDQCDDIERARIAFAEENRLDNLDEDELDQFLLTEDEVKEKERLWMAMNREYLEQLAAKQRAAEGEDGVRKKPKVRKRNKPRDASTARGETAIEATKELLKKKKVSKKLNYDVLEGLFDMDDAQKEKAKESRDEASSISSRPPLFNAPSPGSDDEFQAGRQDEDEPDHHEEEGEEDPLLPSVPEEDEPMEESDDEPDPPAGNHAEDDLEAEFRKLKEAKGDGEEDFDVDEGIFDD